VSHYGRKVLQVVDVTWFARKVTWLVREIWSALPPEITATAEAHPSRALLTLGVLTLVVARLVGSGSSVAVVITRLLLTAAGLLLLLELEVLALSITSMPIGSRRESLGT